MGPRKHMHGRPVLPTPRFEPVRVGERSVNLTLAREVKFATSYDDGDAVPAARVVWSENEYTDYTGELGQAILRSAAVGRIKKVGGTWRFLTPDDPMYNVPNLQGANG